MDVVNPPSLLALCLFEPYYKGSDPVTSCKIEREREREREREGGREGGGRGERERNVISTDCSCRNAAIPQCGSECVGIASSLIFQLIQGADFTSQLWHTFA